MESGVLPVDLFDYSPGVFGMTAQQEPEKTFLITEELAELIESQLSNPHCKKCPYEGGGVNSGIKSMLRSRAPISAAQAQISGKYLYPEKYREFGLTVGLCSCIQENRGIPEKTCEYCYGTGVFVYTNIEVPTPNNCPHWAKDDIYVKGFRCSLYRDNNAILREAHGATIAASAREKSEATDNIIAVLKKRYRGEAAIMDYVEMIECELMALRSEVKKR